MTYEEYRDKTFCKDFWERYGEPYMYECYLKDTMKMNKEAYFNLAPLPAAAPCNVAECNSSYECKIDKQKGNNPMYVHNDKHIESSKINYLSNRAECVFYNQENKLSKLYGMVDDDRPTSAAELVKRIQDGKFVLKDDTKDTSTYDPDRYIQWRDPEKKKDAAGYKAAVLSLERARQDAIDTIAIGTPTEGLAAVKALDAWTLPAGTVAS